MATAALNHGSRGAYRHGCRCLLCRSANAGYAQARRHARAASIETDGLIVAGQDIWRQVRMLIRQEGFTKAEIAARLGYATPRLQWGRRLTVKTQRRFRKFFDALMAEGHESWHEERE